MKTLPPSIALRLRGSKSNRDAIGAAVTVECGSLRQMHMLQAGSGFLSQHSKEMIFGLGDGKGPVRVSIRWPSGALQELRDLPMNHRIWIEEGVEPSRMEPFKAPPENTAASLSASDEHQSEALPDVSRNLAPRARIRAGLFSSGPDGPNTDARDTSRQTTPAQFLGNSIGGMPGRSEDVQSNLQKLGSARASIVNHQCRCRRQRGQHRWSARICA